MTNNKLNVTQITHHNIATTQHPESGYLRYWTAVRRL